MQAVVMEVRLRVCSTPQRAQRFFHHAAHIVESSLPARVRWAHLLQPSHSVLLQRQWERLNGELPLSGLLTQDIGFGLCDPTGRLTVNRTESIANAILADLAPRQPDENTQESVPWILTVNVGIDAASRTAITEQYPPLHAGPSPARQPVAAVSGRDNTYK